MAAAATFTTRVVSSSCSAAERNPSSCGTAVYAFHYIGRSQGVSNRTMPVKMLLLKELRGCLFLKLFTIGCSSATGRWAACSTTRGVFVNQSFEALNLTRPELVAEVHRAYAEAGADVIETNTFGANQVKLAGFGLADRLAEINRAGVRLARQAAGPAAMWLGPSARSVSRWETAVDDRRDGRVAFRRAGRRAARGWRRSPAARDLRVRRGARGRGPCRSTPDRAADRRADGDGRGWTQSRRVPPEAFAVTLSARGATMVGVNCGAGPGRDARIGRADGRGDRRTASLPSRTPASRRRWRAGVSSCRRPSSWAPMLAAMSPWASVWLGAAAVPPPVHIARIQQAVSALSAPRPVPASA